LRDGPGPVDVATGAMAAGYGDAAGGPGLVGRLAGGGLAAPDPQGPARPSGPARTVRVRGYGARVRGVPRLVRGGVAARVPRPASGQSVQCGLLPARNRAGGAVAAPHPQ